MITEQFGDEFTHKTDLDLFYAIFAAVDEHLESKGIYPNPEGSESLNGGEQDPAQVPPPDTKSGNQQNQDPPSQNRGVEPIPQLHDLEDKLREMQDEMERKHAEVLAEKNREILALTNVCTDLDKENNQKMTELEEFDNKLNEKDRTIEELGRENERKLKEAESILSEVTAKAKRDAERYEEEKALATAKAGIASTSMSSADRMELSSLRREKTESESKLRRAEDRERELLDELKGMEYRAAEHEARAASYYNELTQVKESVTAHSKEDSPSKYVNESEVRIRLLGEELASLKAETDKLHTRLKSEIEIRLQLEQETTRLRSESRMKSSVSNDEIDYMKQELEESRRAVDVARRDVEQARREAESLREELKRKDELHQVATSNDHISDNLRATISQLQRELSEARSAVSQNPNLVRENLGVTAGDSKGTVTSSHDDLKIRTLEKQLNFSRDLLGEQIEEIKKIPVLQLRIKQQDSIIEALKDGLPTDVREFQNLVDNKHFNNNLNPSRTAYGYDTGLSKSASGTALPDNTSNNNPYSNIPLPNFSNPKLPTNNNSLNNSLTTLPLSLSNPSLSSTEQQNSMMQQMLLFYQQHMTQQLMMNMLHSSNSPGGQKRPSTSSAARSCSALGGSSSIGRPPAAPSGLSPDPGKRFPNVNRTFVKSKGAATLSKVDQAWQRPLGTWVPKNEQKARATASPARSPSRTPRGESQSKQNLKLSLSDPWQEDDLRVKTEQRVLEELFQRFDVNRQGYLTAIEVGEAMRSILGQDSQMSKVTPDAVMRVTAHLAQQSGDGLGGRVSRAGFQHFFRAVEGVM